MARWYRSGRYYGRRRYYRRNYYSSRSNRRSYGNMRAAKQQSDNAQFVINVPSNALYFVKNKI